jgi:hypothetical protein
VAAVAVTLVLLLGWVPHAGAVATTGGMNASGAPVPEGHMVTSANWSGYAVQPRLPVTQVVGSWVQPAATCGSDQTLSAFWIGIDGYKNQTVEQIGTQAKCDSNGTAGYIGWWQMWPAPVGFLSTSTYPVQAGDTLTASVTRSGTSYVLSLQSSEGWTFSTTQTADAADASAEWIASSPKSCPTCGYADLTDFGTVTFSGARAADGAALRPISSFPHAGGPSEITMLGPGNITRSEPSALTANGKGFSVTWVHS